jgi:predicted RND superfamily exporter protein
MKTDSNKTLIPLSHMLQIVPFLALGLGVDDMFLLTHTYAEQEHGQAGSHSHYQPDVSLTQP